MMISNNSCKSVWSCHLWRQISRLLEDKHNICLQQSSLYPCYLEFSSYLNHCQTNPTKGSNWIILSDKNWDKRGAARDKTGRGRDKTETATDKTGTTRDKTGTASDKKRNRCTIGETPKRTAERKVLMENQEIGWVWMQWKRISVNLFLLRSKWFFFTIK